MSRIPNPSTSPAAAVSSTPRPLSRRKLWMFRFAAVLLSIAAMALLEITLRVTGVGPNLQFATPLPKPVGPMTHIVNGAIDRAYYGTTDLLGPEPRPFAMPKPAKTFRIVFLGGSTVIGFPYPAEIAFPRHVEVLLRRQNLDLEFEVLNAGITAMNSFAEVDLVEQCLAVDPDLIVVHTGHNEFYGPGGPASTAVQLPYSWIEPTFALRRCRTLQLAEMLNPFQGSMQDDLLDTLPRTLEIPLDGDVFRRAESNLRRNLERMVALAGRENVPVLLTTVACNLRDQSPLRAAWRIEPSPANKSIWESEVRQAESELQRGEYAVALNHLHTAGELAGPHARVTYRRAQCLDALDRDAEALAAYQQARDEDVCRFRAPSSFARIVRDVAVASPELADFLDVEQQINAAATDPAGPGYDLYLEHVHYSFDGHRALGRIFAREIQEQILKRDWQADRVPAPDEMDALLGVVPEDHLAAFSSAMQVLQTGPFRGALDTEREQLHLKNLIAGAFHTLEKPRREAFADIPLDVMVNDLIGGLIFIHDVRGNAELKMHFTEMAHRRRPWLTTASR